MAAKTTTVLAAIILSSCFAAETSTRPAFANNAKSAGEPGWKLEQTFSQWGRMRVQICKHGFRVDDPVREYSIVGSAPDWIAHYFSDVRKIEYTVPVSKLGERTFSQRMGMLSGGSDHTLSHWKKMEAADILGTKTDRFELAFAKDGQPLPEQTKKYQIYISKEMQVDKPVIKMLITLYDQPFLGGVPLRGLTGKNTSNTTMNTLSIKKLMIPPAVLVPPKGYKAVKTAEEVLFADPSFF